MNILFLLQHRFAYIGHALATKLKRQGILQGCSGITCSNESYEFLTRQKELVYDPLLRIEDFFENIDAESLAPSDIDTLERKYGFPHLWPYVIADRAIQRFNQGNPFYPIFAYSHEDILKLLQRHFRALEELFNRAKPDLIIGGTIGSIAHLSLYAIADKRNIPTFLLQPIRIKNRIAIARTPYDDFSSIRELYAQIRAGTCSSLCEDEAREFLHAFRKHRIYYDGFVPLRIPSRAGYLIPLLKKSISRYLRLPIISRQAPFFEPSWLTSLRFRIPFHARRLLLKNWPGFTIPQAGESYFFFPLQYEPEISLMLFAPYHINQLALIHNVAQSLPIRMKLYVKEHPAMYGLRGKAYYKELLNIPNVRLIHPEIDSLEIIRNSKGTITISGTAGWESLIFQKPVITFGNVFYNQLPMIRKVHDIQRLPDTIWEILNSYRHDEAALVQFISAMLEKSCAANLMRLWYEASPKEIQQSPDLDKLLTLALDEWNKIKKEPRAPIAIA